MKKSAFFKRVEEIQARYHGKPEASSMPTETLTRYQGMKFANLLGDVIQRALASNATIQQVEQALISTIKKHLSEPSEHSGHSVSFSQTVRALQAPTLLPKIPHRPVSGMVLPFVRLRGFRTTEDALAHKRAQQAARNRYRFQAYPDKANQGKE